MAAKLSATDWVLGLAGAAIGGAVGYFVFDYLVQQGFLALVLPGALLGIGCGALSGGRSTTLGLVAGILALVFGVFCEWHRAPFSEDGSFVFFVTHIQQNPSFILIMVALGGFLGYWFGQGREGGAWPRRRVEQR